LQAIQRHALLRFGASEEKKYAEDSRELFCFFFASAFGTAGGAEWAQAVT
jgi:hypothetical protein